MTADSTPQPLTPTPASPQTRGDSTPAHGGSPTTTAVIAQGMRFGDEDPVGLAAALDLAMDYRGDVALVLRSGARIEGYIYDRGRRAPRSLRILPRDAEQGVAVRDDEIVLLEVTGRDTAAGKTFENWVRRYVEKKLAGERASIESDALDE